MATDASVFNAAKVIAVAIDGLADAIREHAKPGIALELPPGATMEEIEGVAKIFHRIAAERSARQ